MRYKVTGGTDGQAGVEIGDRRYEPGDIVELTGTKAAWLIEKGYLESADTKATKSAPVASPEPETAPAESDATDGPTDGNQAETDPEVTE